MHPRLHTYFTHAYVLCQSVFRSRTSQRAAAQFNLALQQRVRVGASCIIIWAYHGSSTGSSVAGPGFSIRVRSIRSSGWTAPSRGHLARRTEPARYVRVIRSFSFAGTNDDPERSCLNNHARVILVAMEFTECLPEARVYIRRRVELRDGSTLNQQTDDQTRTKMRKMGIREFSFAQHSWEIGTTPAACGACFMFFFLFFSRNCVQSFRLINFLIFVRAFWAIFFIK